MSVEQSPSRVAVIGIDGGSFDVIGPWIERGELPTLAKLVQDGAHGVLQSTIPPVSLPAWASFMTGKSPGHHGLYYFWRDGPQRTLFNSVHLRSDTIWDLLSDQGLTSIVVNVTGTYPPRALQGALVSGMLTPSVESDFTYPPELKAEIRGREGGYRIDFDPRSADRLQDLHRVTESRVAATKYLAQRFGDWRLLVTVFTESDRVQHGFWHDREKSVLSYFKLLDGYLAELLEMLDEQDTVIVMSDHGFTTVTKRLYVNAWLEQEGYLATRTFREVPEREKLSFWRRVFGKRRSRIRWEDTRAYYYGYSSRGININLKGREATGIVEPGDEYEELRSELIARLPALRDPHTDRPVFECVMRKEDLYTGEFLDTIPDIILIPADEAYHIRSNVRKRHVVAPYKEPKGEHSERGMLIVRGPAARRGVETTGRIIDVAPTILYLLCQPVPTDMDGTVLTDALAEEYVATHPVEHCDPKPRARDSVAVYDESGRQEVEDRLRGLGYMD